MEQDIGVREYVRLGDKGVSKIKVTVLLKYNARFSNEDIITCQS